MGNLNCSNCDRKITTAKPFTNPSITGCGTILINFPNFKNPAPSCSKPIKTTLANKYSTPWLATSETITTANAPVAPEIIPGLPPKTAVIIPTINAAYNPTNGATPATNAKAIASGTSASETVSPHKISVVNFTFLISDF